MNEGRLEALPALSLEEKHPRRLQEQPSAQGPDQNSLGNQLLAPSPKQIKANQHQNLVSEHLWPSLLFPWAGSSAPEQAVLWSMEALPSSPMPLPASLSHLLTVNAFDLIKRHLLQEGWLL